MAKSTIHNLQSAIGNLQFPVVVAVWLALGLAAAAMGTGPDLGTGPTNLGTGPDFASRAQDEVARPVLQVPAVEDFTINGGGDHPAWNDVPWTRLDPRGGATNAPMTRIKVAYSSTGLYVLMDAVDGTLTATYEEDFADLWKEDVFEAFLWPDERDPLYFEYEISPLGRELPILIPNFDGEFLGWRPWHYGGDRRVRHLTTIIGGPKESGATIEAWRAEIKIPYDLLRPLRNVPPTSGTRWRANFYRVDHDGERPVSWDWARVGSSFHEYEKFGTLEFE